MPEYVDPAVERLRESDSDDSVTILLGVSDEREAIADRVERAGATVEDSLDRVTLRVTAPESAVDDLCTTEGITSIELEREDVGSLAKGNERSRGRVTRNSAFDGGS